MKIVSKAYLLIIILIVAAVFNLFLLYQDEKSGITQSYSIISIGDIKVKAESISSLATSVANGNLEDRDELEKEVEEVQSMLMKIKDGGTVKGKDIAKIPEGLYLEYNKVLSSWENFKSNSFDVENTSVFDPEATNAMNYVLQKNQDLVLLTAELERDLESLDRNFNTHKEIAKDLAECAKVIGQQSLLISIGEGENSQEQLKEKNLRFEIGIRKLLQISTEDLDVESVGQTHEEIEPIPRENSESLRKIDPLWEAIQLRISILEERSL
ncbi:MAG: two-component sensor histidine kinase, partial [Nitrosopumilus sp.]|nr:two-component sensor histidine kinase [Nitrosopumilus sp.]NNL52932.1 two-component sensor histidine kinase [Nitrosopumilus sp.]